MNWDALGAHIKAIALSYTGDLTVQVSSQRL